MPFPRLTVISADAAPSNTRRGGDVRTLLSPRSVGSTSGFMGVATIQPGDYISSHRHPYSEEFILLVEGEIEVQTDADSVRLSAAQGVLVPKETPHRLVNVGPSPAFLVFHLGPLAPRPELGHVDLETHHSAHGAPGSGHDDAAPDASQAVAP